MVLETDAKGAETAYQGYGTNLLTRRVKGEKTEQYYYLYNTHGDVTGLLDKKGTLAATYDYDAFGTILSQTGDADNNITYAGYQYDKESGLYYLNARYYDSVTARFITEDTYTGKRNDPLSLNLYSYCANNPIVYKDPSGHRAVTVAAFAPAIPYSPVFIPYIPDIPVNTSPKEIIKELGKQFLSMFGLRISDGTKIKGTMDSPHPAPAKSSTEVIDKKNTEIKTSANIKNNPVPGNPPKREASTAGSTSSNGIKEKNKTNENSVEGKGDSAPQKKEKGENKTKEDSESEHMLGESGTQIGGSKTTGQNGETERVDVENPAPGKRPGDVHYHEPNNTKWRYDANSGKLVDPSTGEAAPPKVQKVLGEKWFRKAIEKALEILGELL